MNLLSYKETVLADIKSMTLFNNPMMRAVFSHKECVEELLSPFFHQPIHIEKSQVEYFISNLNGKESRFDIFVESIEVQDEEEKNLIERIRVYLSGLDNHFVEKGKLYEDLPNCYVIFICNKDYYEKGLPIYHIHHYVEETKERVDTGQEILIVNGKYKDESTVIGKLIHDFHCIDPDEMYSEVLKKWMKYYKKDKGGIEKMCEITRKWMGIGYEEGLLVGKEEGYTSGKADGIIQGMSQGLNQGFTNGKMETIVTLLRKKLGYLSEDVVIKINESDEDKLNELIIHIFDIDKEEDIFKYI